ncbi:MAG: alpha/beta hydrolase, partial [Chthoniobacterales bacterium]
MTHTFSTAGEIIIASKRIRRSWSVSPCMPNIGAAADNTSGLAFVDIRESRISRKRDQVVRAREPPSDPLPRPFGNGVAAKPRISVSRCHTIVTLTANSRRDEDSAVPVAPRLAEFSATSSERKFNMPYVTAGKENGENIDIYYKDWGSGQPIVFSHGWPLSADDWDPQMLFFLNKGYRVIATDRRGHGRSTQTGGGHDMDHYADDLKAVTDHLNLKDAIHVGHSTGGGQVVRYLARHGDKNVAKAAIISAVPPLMVKTPANPLGLPKSVFDDLQAQLAANRAKFYYDLPAGPFYGFNRPGVKTIEPLVWNWWRQSMMGGAKAGYDGIV